LKTQKQAGRVDKMADNHHPKGRHQPMQTTQPIAVVGQPVVAQPVDASGHPYAPLITGKFSSDICGGCCSISHFMACCCPCFTFAGIVTHAQIPVACNKSMGHTNSMLLYGILVVLTYCCYSDIMGEDSKIIAAHQQHSRRLDGEWGAEENTFVLFVFLFIFFAVFLPSLIAMVCVSGSIVSCTIGDLRSKFRAKFGIPGSGCTDCLCGWWCTCCTLAQMDRHIALNDNKCGFCDPGPHPGLAALEAGLKTQQQGLRPQAL
jgi:Cys-rich protein (TIGR01571 family)